MNSRWIFSILILLVFLVSGLTACQTEDAAAPTERVVEFEDYGGEAVAFGVAAVPGPDCTGESAAVVRDAAGGVAVYCTPFPTVTATATLAPTVTLTPTEMPLPTASHTVTPTATPTPHVHPTDVPTATVTPGSLPTPVAGQLCPGWVHEQYTVIGPDGHSYPTWHPQVDPAYGCHFGHDHGVDPRTSSANATLPAFGYINAVSIAGGHPHPVEPHAGFKVFVWECGESGDQGANRIAGRLVIHMGTSGLARYTLPHHSAHYSAAACDGSWTLDLQTMVDFAGIGSICGPREGRDFAAVGCVEPNKPETAYEIWTGVMQVNYPGEFTGLWQSLAHVQISPAVFDPVTAVNPNNLTELIYTVNLVYPGQYNPLSYESPFRGCKMEAYHGPLSINNRGYDSVYVTDIYGNVLPDVAPGTPGTLLQTISPVLVDGTNSNASANGQQFKRVFDMCSAVVRPPN